MKSANQEKVWTASPIHLSNLQDIDILNPKLPELVYYNSIPITLGTHAKMWTTLPILGATSALIAILSEFYLGLITLMIFVLIWCIMFVPPRLDAVRFMKTAKRDAYELLQSKKPNSIRMTIAIGKLSRYPKDKESKALIQELKLKLSENSVIDTDFKCGDVYQ